MLSFIFILFYFERFIFIGLFRDRVRESVILQTQGDGARESIFQLQKPGEFYTEPNVV